MRMNKLLLPAFILLQQLKIFLRIGIRNNVGINLHEPDLFHKILVVDVLFT